MPSLLRWLRQASSPHMLGGINKCISPNKSTTTVPSSLKVIISNEYFSSASQRQQAIFKSPTLEISRIRCFNPFN